MKKAPSDEKTLPPPTTPRNTSPPPSYSADSPDITAAFSNLNLGRKSTKPTRDQCIAHLKLLECFHELRETIATNDGLFGIYDSFAEQNLSGSAKAALLLKIREKRWSIYVAKAAKRFEAWWQYGVERFSKMERLQDPLHLSGAMERAVSLESMKNYLPPIGKCQSS